MKVELAMPIFFLDVILFFYSYRFTGQMHMYSFGGRGRSKTQRCRAEHQMVSKGSGVLQQSVKQETPVEPLVAM